MLQSSMFKSVLYNLFIYFDSAKFVILLIHSNVNFVTGLVIVRLISKRKSVIPRCLVRLERNCTLRRALFVCMFICLSKMFLTFQLVCG